MALTTAQLADAIRVGSTTEELAQVTRLATYAATEISRFAPNAPEPVKDEATIRIAGYLFDAPSTSWANVLTNSGAAAILLPYRVKRAGRIDGVNVTARSGGVAPAAVPAGVDSPYRFFALERLNIPAHISTPIDIAATGAGYQFTMLARKTYSEGLLAAPFHTSYDGEIHITGAANLTLRLTLSTVHYFTGGKSLTSTRSVTFRVQKNVEFTFGLNDFSSITELQTGPVTVDDGTDFEITDSVLAAPVDIAINAEITVRARSGRQAGQLTGIYAQRPSVVFWQLQRIAMGGGAGTGTGTGTGVAGVDTTARAAAAAAQSAADAAARAAATAQSAANAAAAAAAAAQSTADTNTARAIPAAGATGQVLRKRTDADYDDEWGSVPPNPLFPVLNERVNDLVTVTKDLHISRDEDDGWVNATADDDIMVSVARTATNDITSGTYLKSLSYGLQQFNPLLTPQNQHDLPDWPEDSSWIVRIPSGVPRLQRDVFSQLGIRVITDTISQDIASNSFRLIEQDPNDRDVKFNYYQVQFFGEYSGQYGGAISSIRAIVHQQTHTTYQGKIGHAGLSQVGSQISLVRAMLPTADQLVPDTAGRKARDVFRLNTTLDAQWLPIREVPDTTGHAGQYLRVNQDLTYEWVALPVAGGFSPTRLNTTVVTQQADRAQWEWGAAERAKLLAVPSGTYMLFDFYNEFTTEGRATTLSGAVPVTGSNGYTAGIFQYVTGMTPIYLNLNHKSILCQAILTVLSNKIRVSVSRLGTDGRFSGGDLAFNDKLQYYCNLYTL